MPTATAERQIVLRRFEGTNLLVDNAFLGPSYLRRAQNWMPGETFRLEKRPGALPFETIPGATRIHVLKAATDPTGNRLLIAVARIAGVDQVYVSTNNGAFADIASPFNSPRERYAIEVINTYAYIGNGFDPIKALELTMLTATNLVTIGTFTDASADPTLVADVGAQILSGTYSFCWCIYDHDDAIWVERGIVNTTDPREVTVRTSGDTAIQFAFPVGFNVIYPMGDRYKAHLMISPVDFPVEFAHDQTPEGVTSGTTTIRQVIADGPPLPLRGPARVGSIMRAYRGRLAVAGDEVNPTATWGTAILQPGNEQAIYNTGIFFPHNARLPRTPEPVTGLGLSSVGEREALDSPLVVLTLTRTYLFFGDFLDDPGATWILVSPRVGCISAAAVTETPLGLFWISLESVYFLPVGGTSPIDVGWPIRPAIQAIPAGSRARCLGLYHKGFLKLAVVPPGETTATEQWWLDLRTGVGRVPSWWGPHRGVGVSALAQTPYDLTDPDVGYHAVEGEDLVETIHERNSYRENNATQTIISIITTGDLDDQIPFRRKVFTRIRSIGFPAQTTSLSVTAKTDGGVAVSNVDPLVFIGAGGAQWNVSEWNIAQWGSRSFTEAQSLMPSNRPRGRTIALQLTHAEAIGLAIRDFEVAYILVERELRSISDQPNT